MPKEYKDFHPKNRAEWRSWLQKNHKKEEGIWWVYYKKETGKRDISYDDAVEEALCFGWIDSAPRKIDADRSALKFTVRKSKSIWSELNKKRIRKLIKDGLMTEAGLEKVKEAKANGSWDTLNKSDTHTKNNTVPEDLQKAFVKNKKAADNFFAFAPSYRKQFLFWIESAKREETRKARVKHTVLMAAANKKPGPSGFKL